MAPDISHEPTTSSSFGAAIASVLTRKDNVDGSGLKLKSQQLRKRTKEIKELRAKRKQRKLKAELRLKEHVSRTDFVNDGALERLLIKTATRGVVTLFNAVAAHQKSSAKTSEKSKVKQAKNEPMSRTSFLEMLKGSQSKSVPANEEEHPKWSVLSDQFMMDAKAADWDGVESSNKAEERVNDIEDCEEEEDDEWE
uniref:RRP15-like protein n=1 Tax=Spongospora subterranea TaxID=70186 RepID=A0A0H5RMX5_9EUKA|eukprot:CRZ10089.1 hypothetical protein [Spongospora subterranea]